MIGDACAAGAMIKTGGAANNQAKACAANIVARLQGREPISMIHTVPFYADIQPDYAVSQVDTYRLEDGRIVNVASAVSPLDADLRTRRFEAQYAEGWYKSITGEAFPR